MSAGLGKRATARAPSPRIQPLCDYCCEPAKLETGKELYPHRKDLHSKRFWTCRGCDAWVGCHQGGDGAAPLGRLANAALRRAKQWAHAAFNPLWKSGRMKRGEAYAWLAKQLSIPVQRCHIGEFDIPQCLKVVQVIDDNPPPARQ